MFRVTSKEEKFFDYFVDAAGIACKAAWQLEDLMVNYVSIGSKVKNIEETEHECDRYVHKIFEQVNGSFITPIDREDIHLIAKELDNITDDIESTAHRFNMFNVRSIPEDAAKLAKLITACTKEVKNLMVELKNMKKSKLLGDKIIEINKLEDDGDIIFRNAIAKLFVTEKDAVEVIKWKEIYQYLENTLDACEDVANIVEGVVMKHV